MQVQDHNASPDDPYMLDPGQRAGLPMFGDNIWPEFNDNVRPSRFTWLEDQKTIQLCGKPLWKRATRIVSHGRNRDPSVDPEAPQPGTSQARLDHLNIITIDQKAWNALLNGKKSPRSKGIKWQKQLGKHWQNVWLAYTADLTCQCCLTTHSDPGPGAVAGPQRPLPRLRNKLLEAGQTQLG